MPTRRPLDWNLSFTSPALGKLFEEEYNTTLRRLALVGYFSGLVGNTSVLFLDYFVNGRGLDFNYYGGSIFLCVACVILIAATFFAPLKYVSLLSCIGWFSLHGILATLLIFVPNNQLSGPQNFTSIFIIYIAFGMRFQRTQLYATGILIVIVQLVASLCDPNFELQEKLGHNLPNVYCLVVTCYCGYFFEKQWKYGFLRRQLVEAQTTKLQWTMARDSSLLRNIFPKSISDELCMRMSDEPSKLTPTATSSISKSASNIIAATLQATRSFTSPNNSKNNPKNKENASDNTQENNEQPGSHPPSPTEYNFQCSTTTQKSPFPVPPPKKPNPKGSITVVLPPLITVPSSEHPGPRERSKSRSPGTPIHTPVAVNSLFGNSHSFDRVALSHSYPCASVILADIVGFTVLSSTISPNELVDILNELFSKFDDIMDFYSIEKVRTIGDAYLCVANMTIPLPNHQEHALYAARSMISTVKKMENHYGLRVRVGVASGPLMAGVTGIMKWNYDIFGQPFAEATVLEAAAPYNCVAVSASIYESCRHNPTFAFRAVEKENGKKIYVLEEEENREISLEVGSTKHVDDLALLAIPEVNTEQTAFLERTMAYIIDPLAKSPRGTEKSEEQPKQGPAVREDSRVEKIEEPNFGYTKEELDAEIANLDASLTGGAFAKPELEKEYQTASIQEVQNYTVFLVFCYAALCFLYLLTDLASNPHFLPTSVKVCYVFPIPFLFGYIWFARKFDFCWFAPYLATLAALLFPLAFVLVSYLMPSELHIVWTVQAVSYIIGYVRIPGKMLLSVQVFLLSAVAVISITTPGLPAPRIVVFLTMFVSFSTIVQQCYQKDSRCRFLAQKKILFDMHQQKLVSNRVQKLLLNIIPKGIIPRLQVSAKGDFAGVVDLFEQASIIFINLTNLVELTADLDANNTFQIYNDLFTLFDEATKAVGLEKIKTINTVYMVASGLPEPTDNHVDRAVTLAVKIYEITSKYSSPLVDAKFNVRIGIASGPIVAGIIGKKKYAYDCWSDTTNSASRMESSGWNGYVQITPLAYDLLLHKSNFQKREKITVKGKGIMDTYVLQLSRGF